MGETLTSKALRLVWAAAPDRALDVLLAEPEDRFGVALELVNDEMLAMTPVEKVAVLGAALRLSTNRMQVICACAELGLQVTSVVLAAPHSRLELAATMVADRQLREAILDDGTLDLRGYAGRTLPVGLIALHDVTAGWNQQLEDYSGLLVGGSLDIRGAGVRTLRRVIIGQDLQAVDVPWLNIVEDVVVGGEANLSWSAARAVHGRFGSLYLRGCQNIQELRLEGGGLSGSLDVSESKLTQLADLRIGRDLWAHDCKGDLSIARVEVAGDMDITGTMAWCEDTVVGGSLWLEPGQTPAGVKAGAVKGLAEAPIETMASLVDAGRTRRPKRR